MYFSKYIQTGVNFDVDSYFSLGNAVVHFYPVHMSNLLIFDVIIKKK